MLPINRLVSIALLPSLLLVGSQLYAGSSDQINDLVAERERLDLETAEIKIQIELNREQVENLKFQIAELQEQDRKLAQQVEAEMEQYDNQLNASQNNEDAAVD